MQKMISIHSRFITAQLVVSGNAKQVEIIEAFGVPPISVKRSVKILREEGIEGFSKKKKRWCSLCLNTRNCFKGPKVFR